MCVLVTYLPTWRLCAKTRTSGSLRRLRNFFDPTDARDESYWWRPGHHLSCPRGGLWTQYCIGGMIEETILIKNRSSSPHSLLDGDMWWKLLSCGTVVDTLNILKQTHAGCAWCLEGCVLSFIVALLRLFCLLRRFNEQKCRKVKIYVLTTASCPDFNIKNDAQICRTGTVS